MYKFSAPSNLQVIKLSFHNSVSNLGASAIELHKVAIIFVMSLCPSVRLHFRTEKTVSRCTYLRENSCWRLNLSTAAVFVRIDRNNRDYMRRKTCVLTTSLTKVTWLLLCYLGDQGNQHSLVTSVYAKTLECFMRGNLLCS
jgi:hypothetical protein